MRKTKLLRQALDVALVVMMMTTSMSAVTFTAARRAVNHLGDPFIPSDVATVTVSGDTITVILPGDLLDNFPWSPAVSVRFGENRSCNGCVRTEYLRRTGDGNLTIEFNRSRLFSVIRGHYRMEKRFETCQETDGRVDTERPNAPCPQPWGVGGMSESDLTSPKGVTLPWPALIMEVQTGFSNILGEFLFLSDTYGGKLRGYIAGNDLRPDQQPPAHLWGELDRMVDWYSAIVASPDPMTPTMSSARRDVFPQFVFGGDWDSALSIQSSGASSECTPHRTGAAFRHGGYHLAADVRN